MRDLVTNGKMFGGLEQQEDAELREFAPQKWNALRSVIVRRRPPLSAHTRSHFEMFFIFAKSNPLTEYPYTECGMYKS